MSASRKWSSRSISLSWSAGIPRSSVDLALRHFPRVVGVRQGRIAFDLPPDRVTPELRETLYAGAVREDGLLPGADGVPATSRVCRPVHDRR